MSRDLETPAEIETLLAEVEDPEVRAEVEALLAAIEDSASRPEPDELKRRAKSELSAKTLTRLLGRPDDAPGGYKNAQ